MTVSDQKTETWKPVPGAGYYEASDLGHIRSVDRTIAGRFYRGVVLKPREDGDGYLVVNITNDLRERQHGVAVARLVLMAHDPGGYAPGLEACHGPAGRKDNRLVNLRWDTKEANREEALALRLATSPPKPKPVKECPRCSKPHTGKGQNCHECVVKLGEDGALLLVAGLGLQEAADRLGYPPVPLFNLAVKYGGARVVGVQASVTGGEPAGGHAEQPKSWLRSVINRRRVSRQNSDAQ